MALSSACTYPSQPTPCPADVCHPRFAEYRAYLSAIGCQLVRGSTFSLWLANTQTAEDGFVSVFCTKPGATIAQGWWKHLYGPNHRLIRAAGPFDTQALAEAA